MGKNTPPDGSTVEPALIYDAGERRTHAEHAAKAYDLARRADSIGIFARDAMDAGKPDSARWWMVAESTRDRAQWHATMAVYEALREGIATRTTA